MILWYTENEVPAVACDDDGSLAQKAIKAINAAGGVVAEWESTALMIKCQLESVEAVKAAMASFKESSDDGLRQYMEGYYLTSTDTA